MEWKKMEDGSSQAEETMKETALSRRMKAFPMLNLFGYGSLWFAGETVALEDRPKDSLKYLKTVGTFANGRRLAHGVISSEAKPSLRSKWLQR